ncbi:acyl-protein synthetase [Vibrio toranzoniae]|uniref:LuxE/PaaK family acyltransferase n=1 Tax=Vibrio toranzoniae TaxID=1194427 RepID=UPI0013786A66|nr:acyl-protein synthetase [Vibrio toranzoniae]NAZ91674.1 acyl-protein synthetase [Vibrio toranzoniae]
MNLIDRLLTEESPYSLSKEEKSVLLSGELSNLDQYHHHHCEDYRKILIARNESIHYLPVRLFKLMNLKSIPDEKVYKVLTSSGTTSQVVSRINLDSDTAKLQTKVLVHIMQSYIGRKRLPMLIIDHPNVIKDRANFSARGAGILGLSNFGRDHTYALNDDMSLNIEAVVNFFDKYRDQDILMFGFTFMVWEFFIKQLELKGIKLPKNNSILIHSGGWKKLQDKAVDNSTFKHFCSEWAGVGRVHNFYGMVEQVGSIFVECEQGYLHAPNFADIKTINVATMEETRKGEEGVICVESVIPKSYPGHRLLTEDLGTIHGTDDCKCGRKGRYFTISGRLKKAELRGCSDTQN